jgi:uncharacterized membrane protein YidH (DUF202 family)
MSRSTLALLWVFSVVLAAIVGWFTGISNATRVAFGMSHFFMYLVLFAVVIALAAGAWLAIKSTHHGDDRSVGLR